MLGRCEAFPSRVRLLPHEPTSGSWTPAFPVRALRPPERSPPAPTLIQTRGGTAGLAAEQSAVRRDWPQSSTVATAGRMNRRGYDGGSASGSCAAARIPSATARSAGKGRQCLPESCFLRPDGYGREPGKGDAASKAHQFPVREEQSC
jgi:hypothetical protein